MTRYARLRTKQELGLPKGALAVEGSLDDPPIVLRQHRLKCVLVCFAGLVAASISAFLVASSSAVALHYFVPTLIGLIGVTSGVKAIFPGMLILDADGVVWRRWFWTIEFRWSDFRRFRAVPDGEKQVEADISLGMRRRLGWRRFLPGLWGPVNLGNSWELPAACVAAVLTEARARWGPVGQDSDTRSLFAED